MKVIGQGQGHWSKKTSKILPAMYTRTSIANNSELRFYKT